MSNNKDNVTAGKPRVGGAVFTAPIGTALPTNAYSDLVSGYASLGYCSEDGLKNNGAITTEKIKAWGGDIVMNPQTEKADEFKITLIESLNVNVLKAVHGDSNVSGSLAAGIAVTANSAEPVDRIWVFDMILKNGILKRVVIPAGKIISIDEVTYDDKSAVAYSVTISAFPDASGNTHYEYIKDPSIPSISLDKQIAEVADGSTITLTATPYPGTETVTWSSSDTNIASVSGGVVTGEDPGVAKITASITVSTVTYKAECYVTVTSAT